MPRWPMRTEEEREAHRKEMKRAKDARYYQRHKAKINEKNAAYYSENRERLLEVMKAYRLQNRPAINAKVRQWQDENREHVRKKNMEWYRKNPELVADHQRLRRARLFGAEGNHSHEDINKLWEVQKNTCACCRKKITRKNAHIDHIIPLALGGSNFATNLQLLCAFCNISKGAKHPLEFMQSRGYLL